MAWVVLAVLVAGWAFAGWQNRPPLVDENPGVFVLAIVASIVVAWLGGRLQGRASAVATAVARAEARARALARSQSAAVSQVVVQVGDGPPRAVGRHAVAADAPALAPGAFEALPWMGPARAQLEGGILEDGGVLEEVDVIVRDREAVTDTG